VSLPGPTGDSRAGIPRAVELEYATAGRLARPDGNEVGTVSAR
jgi:hypothetical protein